MAVLFRCILQAHCADDTHRLPLLWLGVYNVRITSTQAQLLVNGKATALRSVADGKIAVFYTTAAGMYNFTTVIPNPTTAVDMLMSTPDSSKFLHNGLMCAALIHAVFPD